jgi:TolB-like protein/Tfp pilus assembly protein PilF
VVLLVAGALLAGRPEWSFFSTLRSGEPFPKTAEFTAKPAIAILPLANRSDNSAREYFADGLTQDIINALGRFPELTVMSWNAVFPYKGRPANPGEIAHSLAVRYQVEGSVRQIGDRVRVNAQLVDGNGQVLWSASFDEALADVFALQDKITAQIAGTLAIRVTQIEQRRVLTKPTDSLEAYDYVLRARSALQRPARANNVEARVLLRRAIELDPNYAAAYAALAETYHVAMSMGWAESPADFLSRAEEMANKALSIDDSDVRARIVLGRIHIFYHRYDQANAEIDRAIAINPNDAAAFNDRGTSYRAMGQYDRAIQDYDQAIRLMPNSAMALNNRCFAKALADQPEQGLADCNESLRLRPGNASTLASRGFANLRLKNYEAAIADYDAALRISPGNPYALFGRGTARRLRGNLSGGDADIAAAKAIKADIADEMAKLGVAP